MNKENRSDISFFWFFMTVGMISTVLWIIGILVASMLGYYDAPGYWNFYILTGLIWLGSVSASFFIVFILTYIFEKNSNIETLPPDGGSTEEES